MRLVATFIACLALVAAVTPANASRQGRLLTQATPARPTRPTTTPTTAVAPAPEPAAELPGGAAAPVPEGAVQQIVNGAGVPVPELVAGPAAEFVGIPSWFTLLAAVQQQANVNLGAINALLTASGFDQSLNSSTATLTLFAPNNDAFTAALATLPNTNLEGIINNINAASPVLQGHVVQGAFDSATLTDGQILPTLNPTRSLRVTKSPAGVFVAPDVAGGSPPAEVVLADIPASNGVLHIINGVLLWPGDAALLSNTIAPAAEAAPPSAEVPTAAGLAGGFAPVAEPTAPLTPASGTATTATNTGLAGAGSTATTGIEPPGGVIGGVPPAGAQG